MPSSQLWTLLPAAAGLATIHTMTTIAAIMPITIFIGVSSPPDPRLSARGHGRVPTDAGNRGQSDRRWSGSNITYLDGKDQQPVTAICECRIARQFAPALAMSASRPDPFLRAEAAAGCRYA